MKAIRLFLNASFIIPLNVLSDEGFININITIFFIGMNLQNLSIV